MKNVAIIYSEHTVLVDVLKYQLEQDSVSNVDTIQEQLLNQYNFELYDLVVLSNENINYKGNAIFCHHSLLPAFDCTEPEKEAVLKGVKLTGITVCESISKRILAQYPVFISAETHYDELLQEILYIEQTIFPVVVKKILNNEQLDSKNLMQSYNCSGNCSGGGCSKCRH